MANTALLFQRAVEYQRDGAWPQARELYGAVLDIDAADVAAMNNLGMMSPPDEAESLYRRAIAVRPDYAQPYLNLAAQFKQNGQMDEALDWYRRADKIGGMNADHYFEMGSILQSLSRLEDARYPYEKAIELRPDFLAALVNLGTVDALRQDTHRAIKYFQWALAIAPDFVPALRNLTTMLEQEGRLAEADIVRRKMPTPQPLEIESAAAPRLTVLVLRAMGEGNIPLNYIMPPATVTRINWYIGMATQAQAATLPPHDVVFNAIGNADVMPVHLDALIDFNQRCAMMNPPHTIMRTRRDLLPVLLKDIPNVVVPSVLRLSRAEILAAPIMDRLTAAGLSFPLLVRPISGQGGHGLVKLETPEQLAAHDYGDADAFYFITYADFCAADGFFRKYRAIYIDRVAYPYHLAISPHWIVHYVTADMPAHPWKLREEEAFLADPSHAIGEKAWDAIAAIARRMDMDYAGIDFSILPDGRVLVFEANATMLAHLHDPKDVYPYKHIYVPRIFDAFDQLIDRRRLLRIA